MHHIGLRQVSSPEEKNSKNSFHTQTHAYLHPLLITSHKSRVFLFYLMLWLVGLLVNVAK